MGGAPESVVNALVQRANLAGGRDNISVLVIDVISGGGADDSEHHSGASGLRGSLVDPSLDDTTIQV